MSDRTPESVPAGQPSGFDSLNCDNLVVDAVLDTTVRPIRPSSVKLALAEREKIARWGGQEGQSPPADKPADGPGPKNGAG
jgi:hypothetical protein